MTRDIVEPFHPLKVILFGSHARGDAGPDSDVDFLVVFPELSNRRETAVEIMEALAHFPAAKDVIVSTPQEIQRWGRIVGTIFRPALREGRTLYERS
jgi:predicted nucleotidyltransferase